jgi:4-oxalocrotonate tautomerase
MPVVIVKMGEGRTLDQKRQLAKGITEAFVTIGTPAEAINVIIQDIPKSCWARGGKLASDDPKS